MPMHTRILGEVLLVLVGLFYIGFGANGMYALASDPRISLASKATFLPIFSLLPLSGGAICHTLVGDWIRSWRACRAARRLSAIFE
ncbi:MAG: hypothetical protein QY323_03345 [Patescibacteria group bacterium]|nr:MAG: hypothetical protein QY323_03345 [Patescibacteria group bacterium]